MDGGSVDRALDRIEAALARIERSAAHPADVELRDRHERLRAAVSRSLRQLDDVIAGRQP